MSPSYVFWSIFFLILGAFVGMCLKALVQRGRKP